MIITTDTCHITISVNPIEDYDPIDYQLTLPVGSEPSTDDLDFAAVEIDRAGSKKRIAIISETTAYDVDCAVLNGSVLSILQSFTIFHINIDTCVLTGTTEIDSFCPNYNIFRVPDGYIIFGEMDITGLATDFGFQWSFSGNDVFCPMEDGVKPIEFCGDRIKLYDFNGDYYELSYTGELMTHRRAQETIKDKPLKEGVTEDCYKMYEEEPLFEGYEIRDYKRLIPKNPAISTLGDLYQILTFCWKAETAYPSDQKDWTEDVPSYGQCAITAMLVHDLFGGEMYRTKDHSHYYNRIDGHWVDLTADQFWAYGDECDYEAGEKIERKYIGQSGHTKQRYDMLVKNIQDYLETIAKEPLKDCRGPCVFCGGDWIPDPDGDEKI